MTTITFYIMAITGIIALDAGDLQRRWRFGLLSIGFGVAWLTFLITGVILS